MIQVQSLTQADPLEEEIVTQSSILAWKIPRAEEPGGLQSIGSRKRQTQLSDEPPQQPVAMKALSQSVVITRS